MEILAKIRQGDDKVLAKTISLIENEAAGYEELLKTLPVNGKPNIIGITGPPGAGKSTITDGLIAEFIQGEKKVAVICIDPSSPFNKGALLGDRIRMNDWHDHPRVFIRSLSTRGMLGGLHPKTIEICDLLRAASFDYILVETVGVGQSEVEIASLADTTVVIVVPESGDEIQTMKSGLMQIADIFVVNKSDRPAADLFAHHLQSRIVAPFQQKEQPIPVIKTIATQKQGIPELASAIRANLQQQSPEKKIQLMAERAYYLIQKKRMRDVPKQQLVHDIREEILSPSFNLYRLIEKY